MAVLKAPDFIGLVHAVGGKGRRFTSVNDLAVLPDALAGADAVGGLHLFEITINGDVELAVSNEIAEHLRCCSTDFRDIASAVGGVNGRWKSNPQPTCEKSRGNLPVVPPLCRIEANEMLAKPIGLESRVQ
ncbi:hypothetical protein NKI20_25400 [Mesorhizobium sp. M0830]|uniref:hypothetical protein n=1 Tax=Mesorhizobium sp. M0830 TaxID=2957008 RepID=UPI0033362B2B